MIIGLLTATDYKLTKQILIICTRPNIKDIWLLKSEERKEGDYLQAADAPQNTETIATVGAPLL